MGNDKISVIIPVYNVEQYLNRCIESVVNQSYKNIEIILVDDGSPDNCPQICDSWKEKDNRIIVIHKENGGLSDARNAGIKIATGGYIGFVDSDDWISLNMYEILINACISNDLDICEVDFQKTSGEIKIIEVEKDLNIFSNAEAMDGLIIGQISQTVWNKIYKRNVINSILFEKGKYHEDEFWTYQVIAQSKKMGKINWQGYYYYQRGNSIMGSSYTLKRIDALEGKKRRLEFIIDKYPTLIQKTKKDMFFNILYQTQLLILTKDRVIKKEGMALLKKYLRDIHITCNDVDIDNVIWVILSKISLFLCCKIRNILCVGF